ncbi:hypothetical protein FRC09_014897 [Ceratobasidium sp. 395]|nr:hypothetical protein FRC09_014897 [Ceratobasidium sp. 395]
MGKSKLLNTNTLNDAPSNYMALDSMTHDLRLWVDLLNRPNRPDTSIHCLRESQPILAETLINHQEASDLFLRRRLPVRLGALLNEEYWTHMENMSVKSENRLASPRIETQAALASNMLGRLIQGQSSVLHLLIRIDGMTSEGSTCPFTFEEYKTCLLALNKLARLDHSILPNWFIAHIIGLLVRNYDAKLYGQDYAKFNQIITIDTGWQLPRFNRIATAGDIHRSVHTIPHPYYNTSHGGARRKVTQSIDGEMLDGCQPYRSSTTASKLLTKIESSMDVSEVMRHLVEHGCQDLTDDLEVGSSSGHPVARGGLGNIYHVELQDGTKVAVKCLSNLRHIDASDKTSKILKVGSFISA